MDIKYALLGLLSWRSFTGYELKKMMEESEIFYWSGNNNQIYTTLVQMHKDGLVTNEIQHQERYPSRKIYSITDQGAHELRDWTLTASEAPQFRKAFLIQLAWSQQLSQEELLRLLEKYEDEVRMQALMLEERKRRGTALNPARTPREKYLWEMIHDNYLRSYRTELEWIQDIKEGLPER